MQHDPDGHYARLGVPPTATAGAILAAWRRQARRLHPDVPGTGSTQEFVALKAAYDVLSDPVRRRAYDRTAAPPFQDGASPVSPERPAAASASDAAPSGFPSALATAELRFFLWIGLLVLVSAGAAWLMMAIARGPTSGLGAPGPAPAAASAISGAARAHWPLARPEGEPNHYVIPGLGAAWVWQRDAGGRLRPAAELPDFIPVRVLGSDPGSGRMAIRLAGGAVGYVAAARLAPGNAAAAHQALCADRAGPPPANGEVLAHHGTGTGWLALRNRDLEPAVVKLRDARGSLVASVFLAPGGATVLRRLPPGPWITDFAVGEFWSRACRMFAAGERAQRFRRAVGSGSVLDLPPDLPPSAMPADIRDSVFAQP